jgi:TRAP-type transport system periplasmic protein
MLLNRKLMCGLLCALFFLPSISQADELKFAHFMSTKYKLHEGVFLPFAQELQQATDGVLSVRVYPGGELGAGPAKQYDRAVDGIAELVFGLPGYTASQFPLTLLVELPGVVPSEDRATAALWNNIELLDREYRRVKLVSLWNNPAGAIFTRDKPIRSIDDLKGLKIRVPSRNGGKVIEAWGAAPVSMPITDVYNALQTGVIDGVLVDPSVVKSFKLGEVARYMTTGMKSTLTPQFVLMNRDAWKDLTTEQQAALDKLAGANMAEKARRMQVAEAVEGIKAFTEAGNEVIELSASEVARFDAASAQLVKSVVAELEADGRKAAGFVQALGRD